MNGENLSMDTSFRRMQMSDLPMVAAWLSTPHEARMWARDDFHFAVPMDLVTMREDLLTAEDRGLFLWTAVNAADTPVGMFSVKLLPGGQTALLGQVLLNPQHRARHGHDFIVAILRHALDHTPVERLLIQLEDGKAATADTLLDYGFTPDGVVVERDLDGQTLRAIQLACDVDALRLPTRPGVVRTTGHAVRV